MALTRKLVAPVASIALVIGAIGGALIQSSEGKVNRAYRDPVGIWTICYGHTGPEVVPGLVWSDAKCEQVFLQDVAKHQAVLVGPRSCVGASLQPRTNRLDAVTSLTFNIGNDRLCKSTLARKLRAGDYAGAAREFPKWKYADGRVLPGLVTRRAKEQALFNSTQEWKPYVVKAMVTY